MSVFHPFLNRIMCGSGSSHMPNSFTAIFRWSKGLWQNPLISNVCPLNELVKRGLYDPAGPCVCNPIGIRNARPVHFLNPGCGVACAGKLVLGRWYHNHWDNKLCWALSCVLCIYHVCNVWTRTYPVQLAFFPMVQVRKYLCCMRCDKVEYQYLICVQLFVLCLQHSYVEHNTAWNTIRIYACFLYGVIVLLRYWTKLKLN